MSLLGRVVARIKQTLVPARSSSLWGTIREAFAGAWQKNVECDDRQSILAFSAVYSCVTIIASDIAKLRIRLMQETHSLWGEADVKSPFWPVLRKPNSYQTRIQFFENWIVSRLLNGNTYVLKVRDSRGIVVAMHILDPSRVIPLVAEDGSVFYQINNDQLARVVDTITVPASEIIHDRAICLWHPLVGVSPIYACGASATQGNRIQANSATFFQNMSRPSGMLSAPGSISNEVASRLKATFEQNYSGHNLGRLFVAGDGIEYKPLAITASDAQLIEQLKWTVEDVARCFRVPAWKIGAGVLPAHGNSVAHNRMYYDETLQNIIESIELLLDEGLALPLDKATEFDLQGLLRMDAGERYKAHSEAIKGGWMAPNEARRAEGLKPVAGGDTPYMQQQQFSLAALDRRDQQGLTPPPLPSSTEPAPQLAPPDDAAKEFLSHLLAAMDEFEHA